MVYKVAKTFKIEYSHPSCAGRRVIAENGLIRALLHPSRVGRRAAIALRHRRRLTSGLHGEKVGIVIRNGDDGKSGSLSSEEDISRSRRIKDELKSNGRSSQSEEGKSGTFLKP